MGKTSATYTAIRNAIRTAHGADFEAIVMTLRTPFDAVVAGDLCRQGMSVVIGPTADITTVRGGAARRVLTSLSVSIYIVAMLEGRTGGTNEETLLTQMFDAVDSVVATLDAATRAPATTFAGLQVDNVLMLYDPDGSYAAVEIQITTAILRA